MSGRAALRHSHACDLALALAFNVVQALTLHQGRVDPLLPLPMAMVAPDSVPLPIWQWQGRLSLVQAMQPLMPDEGSASRPTIAAGC